MRLTDGQMVEILEVCHERNAARSGIVMDAAVGQPGFRGWAFDEAEKAAAPQQDRINMLMVELITILQKIMAHPQVVALMGKPSAPAPGPLAVRTEPATPPCVPSPDNPTGASPAEELMNSMTRDSLDAFTTDSRPSRTLEEVLEGIRGNPRPRQTLADVLNR